MTFKENSRHWLQKSRTMAVSLPFALLAALVLIGINEAGHMRSQEAVVAMNEGQQTRNAVNRLLQSMLDAETGQRGYLLTGNETYLEPYDKAVVTVQANLDELRNRYLKSPDDLQQFANLSREVSRKLAEMELSLRLRRQGNEDAWKLILHTDVGKEHMQSIRKQAHALIDRSAQTVEDSRHQIVQSLMLSRIGIATVTAIGLLAFYMYLRQARTLQQISQREQEVLEHERERLEGLVRERTASLSELASHLQQVREDERTRIAREVHDELGSLLVALKMDVNWLHKRLGEQGERTPEAAGDMRTQMRCKCQNMSRLIENAVDNVGRIITDLRPSILDHQGLWAALEWQAQEFVQSAELELAWQMEVPGTLHLPEPAAIAVFRIFQEMLSNVGRHAQASAIDIAIDVQDDVLQLRVRDNGVGATRQALEAPTAYGVMGMRERARQLGGQLSITSEPGQGSCLQLQIPLELS